MTDLEMLVVTGPESRLYIKAMRGATGRVLIAVAPQWADRLGAWRLQHSALCVTPEAARDLAHLLGTMADAVETET